MSNPTVPAQLFQVAVPASFKASSRPPVATFEGPGDRWLDLTRVRWRRSSLAFLNPAVELLVSVVGPAPFLAGLRPGVLKMLTASAEPGTLEILGQENASLAGRPALLIKSRFTRHRPMKNSCYMSFTRSGKPVMAAFTAPVEDDMEWTHPILESIVLLG